MITSFNKTNVVWAKIKPEFICQNNSGILINAAIKTTCPECNKESIIPVNETNIVEYAVGMKVQTAFPYLDADNREQILSGICPNCWNTIMSDTEFD